MLPLTYIVVVRIPCVFKKRTIVFTEQYQRQKTSCTSRPQEKYLPSHKSPTASVRPVDDLVLNDTVVDDVVLDDMVSDDTVLDSMVLNDMISDDSIRLYDMIWCSMKRY